MSDDSNKIPDTPEGIDEAMESLYGEVLDANYEIIQLSRESAKQLLLIKEVFLDQAVRCEELAALHIRRAQVVSSTFSDLLFSEWQITEDVESDGDAEAGA